MDQAHLTHRCFTVAGDWDELLELAPVCDIEVYNDQQDFTRYHLATEEGLKLVVDVVRIPKGEGEEFAVVGTIDVREQAKLDGAI